MKHWRINLVILCSLLHIYGGSCFKWPQTGIMGDLNFSDQPDSQEPSPNTEIQTEPIDASSKNKRLFNFGMFPFMTQQSGVNAECGVEGTKCVSHIECAARGGRVKGKCYKGFGVCCASEIECGGTVRANETYLVNPSYPRPVTTIGNCQYNIEKMNKNICQMRFDMESLVLVGPNISSQCLQDTLSIHGAAGQAPIVVCGTNTGQHTYMDWPEGASSARVSIATATQGFERNWKIKVSQISCNSRYKAPDNCLQYYTDYAGTLTSFNYQPNDGVYQLANQMYTVCVKTKPGFCGITYKSDDFSLSNTGTTAVGGRALTGDNDCTTDFVSIFTSSKDGFVLPDRYCGNRFQDVTTFSKPFEVRVVTDGVEPSSDINNRGFKMNFLQIPC